MSHSMQTKADFLFFFTLAFVTFCFQEYRPFNIIANVVIYANYKGWKNRLKIVGVIYEKK